MVFHHAQDRPLIYAQIIQRYPAGTTRLSPGLGFIGRRESRVEGIFETVLAIDLRAVCLAQAVDQRNTDFRRKGDRADSGRRRNRAVIKGFIVTGLDATRPIFVELYLAACDRQVDISRSAAGGEPPDVSAVVFETTGILNGVVALRIGALGLP